MQVYTEYMNRSKTGSGSWYFYLTINETFNVAWIVCSFM